MSPEAQTIIGILLLASLLLVVLPFEKKYAGPLFVLGQHPGFQLFMGILVVWLAMEDGLLGMLAFVVFFLWMADIQLLSIPLVQKGMENKRPH